VVSPEFVSLGLGRFARAERIIALEPIEGEERGPGRRTRVWLDGRNEPMIASRSEAAILADLGGAADPGPDRPSGRSRGDADEPPSLF
jgi:hypothetical protein